MRHEQFIVTTQKNTGEGLELSRGHHQYEMDANRADTRIADETASAPVLYCVLSSKP